MNGMNWQGMLRQKPTIPRKRSYRKSGTNCTLGSPACWSPTPTKTVSRHDPTPSPTSTQFNAALPKAHDPCVIGKEVIAVHRIVLPRSGRTVSDSRKGRTHQHQNVVRPQRVDQTENSV